MLFVGLLAGCGSDDEGANSEDVVDVAPSSSGTGEVEPLEVDTPAVPPEAAPDVAEDTVLTAEAAEAIQGALEEADQARGSTTCEEAYRAVQATLASLRKTYADMREPPPEAAFLSVCEELPGPTQECMVISYAVRNQDRCARLMGALDPALRAKAEALLSGEPR